MGVEIPSDEQTNGYGVSNTAVERAWAQVTD